MKFATAHEVLDTLRTAGLSAALTPDYGLSVSPARLLTPDIRDGIRMHREELIECLTSYDARAASPESGQDTQPNLRQADTDYLRHHFTCPTCCAAEHGRGDRCPTGSVLWASYGAAIWAAPMFKTTYRRGST